MTDITRAGGETTMKTQNDGTKITSQQGTGPSEKQAEAAARRKLCIRAGCLGGLVLVPIAAALLASACGDHGTENTTAAAPSAGVIVQTAENAAVTPPAVTSGSSVLPAVETVSGPLPPDLAVSVPDTLVQPGQSVEITVEATPDVVEMALLDGLLHRQAFTYDSLAKVWRASYRIPLRPSQERFGLSVTAKNE